MTTATSSFPENFSRVWIRGRIIDLGKAARNEKKIGFYGSQITFEPSVKTLTDQSTDQIMVAPTFSASPDIVEGYFAVEIPATNDPDIIPEGWTYLVQEPTGRHYNIEVPWDTPQLHDPDDPLDGKRVIELSDIVPEAGPSGGTVQLIEGRGITAVGLSPDGHLIVAFTDNVSVDIGPLPVWAISQAADYDGSTPPTDGQLLIYDGSAWVPGDLAVQAGDITSGTVAYARLPVGTTSNHVAAADDARMSDARTPTAHTHSAADVISGYLNIARIPTGTTDLTVALGNHKHTAADITSGMVALARLPVGTGSSNVAAGDHVHAGSAITSGTVAIARLPVGTTSGTVAAGNHIHLVSGGSMVTLTDAATVYTDASQGSNFRLMLGDTPRTLAPPTNPTDGQQCWWEIMASATGGNKTLNLSTAAGGFAFGTTITATTATVAGKSDFIQAIYSSIAGKWRVVEYQKGY